MPSCKTGQCSPFRSPNIIHYFDLSQMKISMDNQDMTARKFWASMNFVDYKFILIPVLFVLLRMWTCILTILTEYANIDLVMEAPVINTILEYLTVSIVSVDSLHVYKIISH